MSTSAAPLAPRMSHWLGKRTSSLLFAIVGVSLGLSPLLLSYLDLFFLPGDPRLLPTLFVIGAIYGAMGAVSLINTSSMLADVVEDSAVRPGRHEAGTFFAAARFMQHCSPALKPNTSQRGCTRQSAAVVGLALGLAVGLALGLALGHLVG